MPGPWRVNIVEYDDADHFGRHMEETLSKTASETIAQVEAEPDPDGTTVIVAVCGNGPYGLRNAQLIAAAPDLAEALLALPESSRSHMAQAALRKAGVV